MYGRAFFDLPMRAGSSRNPAAIDLVGLDPIAQLVEQRTSTWSTAAEMGRVNPVKVGERCKIPTPSQARGTLREGVETRRRVPDHRGCEGKGRVHGGHAPAGPVREGESRNFSSR